MSEAKAISKLLLKEKLIACANILPKIHSMYTWEGEIEESEEIKVIFKTRKDLFSRVEARILENCEYKIPEISLFLAEKSHFPYQQWLFENLH
jgi:periplasmic divalent cation tolerance protein